MKRKTGVPKVNRARRAKEFARAYGSVGRVEFVKGLPCVVRHLRCEGAIENAHIETGGVGRKSDARLIVPLCQKHHAWFHSLGRDYFEFHYELNLEKLAEQTEARWQQFSGRVPMETKNER